MHDVIIIGSGFSVIGAAIKLQQAGYNYTILEKSSELGGVWRDNIYPGCACDIPAIFYSYSFSPKYNWSKFFAEQKEIKNYIHEVVAKYKIMQNIKLNHELFKAAWNTERSCWNLTTSQGSYGARFIILGTGPMHEVVVPTIPGIGTFSGESFHSAKWNQNIDLNGKRVAVIGTGASAIQFVPEIQKKVKELTVFQRTAPWVIPKRDFKIKSFWKKLFKSFPFVQRIIRTLLAKYFEKLNASLNEPIARKKLQALAIKNIKRSIKDLTLQKKLIPSYEIGCKRILQSNNWYRSLNRENVNIVSGISRIENNKAIDSDGNCFEVDVIIYATGFKVSNPPVAKLIYGLNGKSLADDWDGSPKAYLGTALPNCPNAFLMLGPNLYAFTSAFTMIELQLQYILKALNFIKKTNNIKSILIKDNVIQNHNKKMQETLEQTVWRSSGCASYFLDKNDKNSTNWPYSISHMKKELNNFKVEHYKTYNL